MSILKYTQHLNLREVATANPAIAHYINLLQNNSVEGDSHKLRKLRHEYWLNAALATINSTSTTAEICSYWSRCADEIIKKAWSLSGGSERNLCLACLGKLGANELNLSSDVDLFIVSQHPATTEDLHCLQAFQKLLSNPNESGFCFRIDFDLRPGGRLGPRVSSLNQLIDYFWNYGATWERVAFLRSRILDGPETLSSPLIENLHRFIFRKYIDFNLFEDLKFIRQRVHQTAKQKSGGIDLKLSEGGIRDIELFINSMQVIHGGRDENLQTTSTTKAALRLIEKSALPEEQGQLLLKNYWILRHYEHLAQIPEDQQTHFYNFTSEDEQKYFQSLLLASKNSVAHLFDFNQNSENQLPPESEHESWLSNLGFSEHSQKEIWKEILSKTALSGRTERDELSRRQMLYNFVTALSHQQRGRDRGLIMLKDFLAATRAKSSFYKTLNRDPRLTEDLALLFCSAPLLGQIITSRPELIDELVFFRGDLRRDSIENLLIDLSERKLYEEIMATKLFLRQKDILTLNTSLTSTADAITTELLSYLRKSFDSQIEIIALGKWGSQEMGLKSDLDFVFITPEVPTEADHKVAKRFVSHLTTSLSSGAIYSIDLRLRPSGQAGPLLVSQERIEEYLSQSAQAWERQSYLKARPLFENKLNFAKLVSEKSFSSDELNGLLQIREKVYLEAKNSDNSIDLKNSPGGLLDIDLTIQTLKIFNRIDSSCINLFSSIKNLSDKAVCPKDKLDVLSENYKFLRTLEQFYVLKSNYSTSVIRPKSEAFVEVAYELASNIEDLSEKIKSTLIENHSIIKGLDPIYLNP